MMISKADIEERFIRAAETDRLRSTVGGTGPAQPGNSMPTYVHDWADKNGWGSERLKEERAEFFKVLESRCTPKDISEMEECLAWTADFLDDPKQRRALWAWATSRLPKSFPFKTWCKRERIHPNTGKNRKNAAVEHIIARLIRYGVQREDIVLDSMLLDPPVWPYVEPTFESAAQTPPRDFSWRSDPSLRPVDDPDQRDLKWSQKQNERRRQQRAKREREENKAA